MILDPRFTQRVSHCGSDSADPEATAESELGSSSERAARKEQLGAQNVLYCGGVHKEA